MRLTKKKAIELSVELWAWLAETGKEKEDWIGWEQNGGQYLAEADCFLCDYVIWVASKQDVDGDCDLCPYYKKYNCYCIDNDNYSTPFEKWCDARAKATRKKYATQFLEQLKALQENK